MEKKIPEHLSLWQQEVSIEQFQKWCGNQDLPFKSESRRHIASRGYKSVLDAGAGVCSEYYGFRADGYQIDYTATDITPKFVNHAAAQGIKALVAPMENLPFEDNSFECGICHDVLNHQKDPIPALLEMLRVTEKEIIVSFFKPFEKDAVFNEHYHGKYRTYSSPTGMIEERSVLYDPYRVIGIYNFINKEMLISFLKSQNVSFSFSEAADKKIMLHIEKRGHT